MTDFTLREQEVLDEALRHARAYIANASGSSFANPMTSVGDLIVGIAAGAPARLAAGAQGTILTLDAGAPAWRYKPELGFLRLASPTAETDWFEAGSLDAKWTAFNSPTTAFTAFGELLLGVPASGAGTYKLKGIYQAVPTGSFTIMAPLANYSPTTGMSGGLFLTDHVGGKFVTWTDATSADFSANLFGEQLYGTNWTNDSTPTANVYGPLSTNLVHREPWAQMRYDSGASKIYWDASQNGRYFQNITSATVASFLTNAPTRFGIAGDSSIAAGTGLWGARAFLCYHDANLNH